MKVIRSSIYPALLILALAGCATKPAVVAAPDAESSSVQAEAAGLAPSGDPHFQTINFAILFGSKDAVASWTFAISNQKSAVKTITGNQSNLPDSLTWDGKNDADALAPEGSYTAVLSIDYAGKFKPATASSKPFILDINPPTASFSPNPAQFAYAPGGVKGPVTVTINAKPGLAKIAAWTIDVFDASGKDLKSLAGSWPTSQATWDGKSEAGELVQTAMSYPAVLTLKDEFGNKGTFKGSFAVADIPSAPEQSLISTRRNGFSPTSESVKNSLDLLTTYGSKASIVGWKVVVMSAAKGAVKTFSGDGSSLPEYSRWDGKDDSGAMVPEGSYYATLDVDYGKTYKAAMVKSGNFSLVTTPPSGSVTVDPPTVALADLGPRKPVNFTIQAKSAYAQLATWTLSVLTPDGTAVTLFQGNWPNNKIAWDGKTTEGGTLDPGVSYTVEAKVQDEYGNVGDLKGSLMAEGLPSPTEPSSIAAASAGFAPTGDKSASTMDFSLSLGDAAAVTAWRVDMVGADSVVQKSFTGTGGQIPAKLTWDGKLDSGSLAPEGRYSALLTVEYDKTYVPAKAETKPFILDITPPAGSISLSTDLFSPDGTTSNDTVTIKIDASSALAKIENWTMTIYDPANNPFADFKGDWPGNSVVWNGKNANGDLVESASDYAIVAKVRDEFGNVGEIKKVLPTDILVLKTSDGYRIRVSSIVFKPFTADYRDVPADRAARNLSTLDLLAGKLKKFSDYRIKLEGHAVMINWDDKAKGQAEQRAILIPLSKARAEAIQDALVTRGIEHARLVIDGVGAQDPVVPDSDYANRWRNRRVEFYLQK